MQTGRRIVIDRPGGYDRLAVRTFELRRPAPGEIAIDVRAIGVNFADCVARMGLYASARELAGYPLTPGFELAGRVAALGAGVGGPAPGTPVMALTLFGGYSTSVCLPASQVFALPDGMSIREAAGFPTVFLTAWYALHHLARAGSGDRVLVHSAAGGVGGALLQLCRRAGCRTLAVVGARAKMPLAEALGADEVLLGDGRLWRSVERSCPRGLDIILDANGGPSLRRSYRHLAPGGRLIVYGFHTLLAKDKGRPSWPRLVAGYLRTPRFSPLHMTRHNRSVLAFNLSFMFDQASLLAAGLRDLLAWYGSGELAPLPVRSFAFEDAADAHRALESGTTTGKLVLEVPVAGGPA
jgi:NADPH:quinone reductase-like Zn-dependent oxidoreductase